MASVSIDNVAKFYGNHQVIHGIDIDIADGEFVTLVGPSGCGKSTLLRMIAGLEEISDGDIRIGDRVVNDVPPKERDIAMVFQNYALYPHMTVAQNMGFALKLKGESRAAIDVRVKEAAAILALEPYLDKQNVLMEALGSDTLPTTIFYDAKGKEQWRVRGSMDWAGERAKTLIEGAMNPPGKS